MTDTATDGDKGSHERAEPSLPSVSSPRFGRLLVIILATFIISGVLIGPVSLTITAILNAVLVVVAFRTTGLRTNMPVLFGLATLALVAVVLTALIENGSNVQSVPAFAQFVLLSILIFAMLNAVLQREHVDIQTIFGAVSAYLLIGLAFAWLYLAMDIIDETQFSIDSVDTNQFPDFSFVVLTTLGFGNQVPTAPLSSRLVVSEAVAGQIFLATFIARLVALYGRKPKSDNPPPEPN